MGLYYRQIKYGCEKAILLNTKEWESDDYDGIIVQKINTDFMTMPQIEKLLKNCYVSSLAEEDMGDDGHPLPPFEKATFIDSSGINLNFSDALKVGDKYYDIEGKIQTVKQTATSDLEDPNGWVDDAIKESQKHNRHSLDLLEAGMDETNPKDLIGMTKAPLELVPPAAIIHMAMAMKNGAAKYGPYNWRDKKVQAMVYIGAAQRHLLSYLDREDDASDSGVHHLAHAMACLGILLDAFETGNLIDNRPTKGVAAELLERFTEKRDG